MSSVDFAAMARELGTRANVLRHVFKIPTTLQKLVRRAKTFIEIAALSGEFPDRNSSACGPKYEDFEFEEYQARRAEIFPAYLERFNTLEEFSKFGRNGHPALEIVFNESEAKAARQKFEAALRREITAASENLDALLSAWKTSHAFPLFTYHYAESFKSAINTAFFHALREAQDIAQRVAVFQALPENAQSYVIQKLEQRQRGVLCPWRFVWEEAATLEEVLYLEKHLPNFAKERVEFEKVLLAQLVKRMESIPTFAERLSFAMTFLGRDRYSADEFFSRALELAAQAASTIKEVLNILKAWQGRAVGKSYDFLPELPDVILDKWDSFFLEEAKSTTQLQKLARLRSAAPFRSKTHRVASQKLEKYFETQLRAATSEEKIDQLENKAKSLDIHHIGGYSRKNELERGRMNQRTEELWQRIEDGKTVENEKRVLISLFHHFKDDASRQQEILRRLVKYFPAESVDEIPAEMM